MFNAKEDTVDEVKNEILKRWYLKDAMMSEELSPGVKALCRPERKKIQLFGPSMEPMDDPSALLETFMLKENDVLTYTLSAPIDKLAPVIRSGSSAGVLPRVRLRSHFWPTQI